MNLALDLVTAALTIAVLLLLLARLALPWGPRDTDAAATTRR